MFINYGVTALPRFILWSCFIVLPTLSLIGQVRWQSVNDGLYGAVTVGMGFSGNGDVFAGTQNGIYRLLTGSEQWQQVLAHTESRAIGSASDGILVAGGTGKMFRSVDNGWTWEEATCDSVDATRFLRASDGTLYALTLQGIRRSDDTGKSWHMIAKPDNSPIRGIALTGDGTLVVGITDAISCFRISSDRGETWNETEVIGGCNALTRTRDDTLIAGTSGGIGLSVDGKHWTWVGDLRPYSLHASSDGYLYAIMNSGNLHDTATDGIHCSSDNGRTWRRVSRVIPTANTLAVGPDGALWMYSDNSIFRSSDHGESWKEFRSGLTNTTIDALESDSTGRIYTLLRTRFYNSSEPRAEQLWALYFSVDNGNSWVLLKENLNREYLAVDQSNDLFVSAEVADSSADSTVTRDVLLHSTDGGLHWQIIRGRGAAISVATNSHGVIAVGSASGIIPYGSVLISTDRGSSWKQATFPYWVQSVTVSPGGTIIVGLHDYSEWAPQQGAIYRSTDFGETWDLTADSLIVKAFGVRNDGYLFASAVDIRRGFAMIYRSSNDGETWEVAFDSASADGFTFDRQGRVFTWGSGLRSTDNGSSWSRMTLQDRGLSPYQIIAAANGNLFAREWRTIYRSTDNGLSWQSINGDLPAATYLEDFTLGVNGDLFAGTTGRGLYRADQAVTSNVAAQEVRTVSPAEPVLSDLQLLGTDVSFILAQPGDVSVKLYSLLADEVASTHRDNLPAGRSSISLLNFNLASGSYVLSVRSGETTAARILVQR